MQTKKNHKADLRKNSSIYFVIGLSVILFISWQAIEWKTNDKNQYDYKSLNVEDDDDEEIPITEQLKTPPPSPLPPPLAPEVIEIVQGEEEVEETVIESTETSNDEIIEVDDVDIEEEEDINVPFAIIEDVPIFPGCEKVSKDKRRDCFQEQIN